MVITAITATISAVWMRGRHLMEGGLCGRRDLRFSWVGESLWRPGRSLAYRCKPPEFTQVSEGRRACT